MQDELIVLAVIVGIPLIWSVTNFLLLDTKYYKRFFIINVVVLIMGEIGLSLFHHQLFGPDSYYLGIFLGSVSFIAAQVLVSFIAALIIYWTKIRTAA
jgi:hypothetical protein